MQIGQLVIEKEGCHLWAIGEVGVCYETYYLGNRFGFSCIFERGGYDGFSPEDEELFLTVIPQICGELAFYHFDNAFKLLVDHQMGVFKPAFERAKKIGEENAK